MFSQRVVRAAGSQLAKNNNLIKYRTSSSSTAINVFKKSCYYKVDFKINEEQPLKEAITRFTVFNVGCLAVTDKNDTLVGVLSQRDYINKVAAQKKTYENLKVKDICTYGNNVIVAKKDDSLESCMNKMSFKNIHHLLIVDEKNPKFIGMISMKDVINDIMKDKQETITRLTDFNIGRGAFFGSE
jgi:predicted transcriptional regulator